MGCCPTADGLRCHLVLKGILSPCRSIPSAGVHITIDWLASLPHRPSFTMTLRRRVRIAQPLKKTARIVLSAAWALHSNCSGRF